jgi:hypothetical protein
MRSQVFNYLSGAMPQMAQAGQDYAAALKGAASNAGWGQEAKLAQDTLAGKYLNGSPQLDRALATNRAAAQADAANQTARIRSGYGKNGMGFSTASQQADQSNRASANAQANQTNTQAYLQNYLAERGNQNNAGSMLAQAVGTPLNYMGGVSGAYASPLGQIGNILSALSSGGQSIATNSHAIDSPSAGSSVLSGIGSL